MEREVVEAVSPEAERVRLVASSPATGPQAHLALARAIGNRAMGRLLARTTAGAAVVSRNTSWGVLKRAAIAKEMLAMLPGDPALFEDTFGEISWNARDDVAHQIVALIRADPSPSGRVAALAPGAAGRHALLRVVRELQEGYTTDTEAKDMQDLLAWMEGTTPTVRHNGADTIEVEVITFDRGFAPLDKAGETLFGKGAKGHTAIIVGGLAYSFDEGGWEVGKTKAEYLAQSENVKRDGYGQVLELNMHDAGVVQRALARSANKGIYLLGGDVCSDATAGALNSILAGNLKKDHNPTSLRNQIEALPIIFERRYYHNGVLVPAPAKKLELPSDAGATDLVPSGAS